jgi:hypothetical protein
MLMSIPSSLNLASYAQGTVLTNQIGVTRNDSGVTYSNSNSNSNVSVSVISNDQELKARLLAKDLEDTIRDGISALELISNTTPVTNPPDTALLKSTIKTLHGIPQNADQPKRRLVQDVLYKYKIFQYIGYQTRTGDLYFTEPYSHQVAIHTLNFAFREHYKGAVTSRGPYLSNVITNVVTDKPNAIVAIPIYSQNGNNSLVGLLTASLNFTYFDQSIRSLDVPNNVGRYL